MQPVPGLPHLHQGFILEADGKAESVNMSILQYETWQRQGNTLVLTVQSIGNHQTVSFSDTLRIHSLTADSLVLQNRNLRMEFTRKMNQ